MYRSKRIRKVNEQAKILGYPFYILSGKYGLIAGEERIEYDDHLLKEEEVPNMVRKISEQLIHHKINCVIFFYNSIESDANVILYIKSIKNACENLENNIIICTIDIPYEEDRSRNGSREIWQKAIREYQLMVINRDPLGKEFIDLFDKSPNDGMLYYQRGEAYESQRIFEKARRL